jgi:hypothetical protein
MSCLLGNTESRIVYKNFNLENLNSNAHDESHYNYQKYLQYNKFIPQNDNNYFIHTALNIKPNPASTEEDKGWFNIFPLDLMSITDELKIPSTNLGKLLREYFGKGLYIVKKKHFSISGIVSTSPLKLELEFSPVPSDDLTWYLTFTFVYLNKINFPGSKTKQDISYDYVMS